MPEITSPRAHLATVDVGLRGPVNGMGESDLRGSYYQIALTFPDDELVRGKMTFFQLQQLRGLLDHFIAKANS